MNTQLFKSLSFLVLSFFAVNAHAIYVDGDGHTILDFEGLTNLNTFDSVNSYGGIDWLGTVVGSQAGIGADGSNSAGGNIFFLNNSLTLTSQSSSGFDLYDAYFLTATDSILTLDYELVASTTGQKQYQLFAADGWTQVTIDLFDINTLTISAIDAATERAAAFAIDNVDVPEPSTLALLGLGLLGLSLSQMKRKS